MDTLYTCIYIVLAIVVTLVLCYIFQCISGDNVWVLLKILKYAVIIPTCITIPVFLVQVAMTHQFDPNHYTFWLMAYCVILDFMTFLITFLTKKFYDRHRRLKIESWWDRSMLFYIVTFISAPAAAVLDVLGITGVIKW